jgi:hypothetical protein
MRLLLLLDAAGCCWLPAGCLLLLAAVVDRWARGCFPNDTLLVSLTL